MNTAAASSPSKRQDWGMEDWKYLLDSRKSGTEEGENYLKDMSLHLTQILRKFFLQE